jgi:putative ABC transport system permease protein
MLREIRYGWRHLSRARGFSLIAIVTLALAGGGTGAMVSLLEAIVLRPLNVPEPERLAVVTVANDKGLQGFISLPAIEDLRRAQDVFTGLCGSISGAGVRVEVDGVMSEVSRDSVTGDCLQMLGVRPRLGRLIGEQEYARAEPVVVIGERFWRQELRGDPSIVGKTLRVQAVPLTIIGVASAATASSIDTNQTPDVILPLSLMGRLYQTPAANRAYELVGRLRPGVTLAAAQSRMPVLWPDVHKNAVGGPDLQARQYMRDTRQIRVASGSHGLSRLRERYARPLSLLLWLAFVVLAVACFNVGGLLLTRMFARENEFGVHLALGATWSVIARQLLIEGLMLSLAATVLATPLTYWFAHGLGVMLWTAPTPLGLQLTPDAPVLVAMLFGGVLCGVTISLPSVTFWRFRPARVGGSSARSVTGGITWTGRTLIAGQLALTLALMFSAGLFMQHLAQLRNIDPGYHTEGIFSLRPSRALGAQLPPPNMAAAYQREILERLSRIDGVSGVAMANLFPFGTRTGMALSDVRRLDSPAGAGADEDGVAAQPEFVSPGFFDVLGIKLIRGRTFGWEDDASQPPVAVINASLARQLFGGGAAPAGAAGAAGAVEMPEAAAIGKRIKVGSDPKAPDAEIVGVVTDASPGDVRIARLPMVYRPIFQETQALAVPVIVLRARGGEAFAAAVRQTVTASGQYYVGIIRSIEEQIARTMVTERTLFLLSSFVGGLSVLLAALGLYSLLAYSVGRRMRELALRMALGATHTAVRSMVIREGLTLAMLGIVIGVPIALASGRLSRSYLEELPAPSAGLVVAVAALLLAIGLIAVAAPARRAARTDPAVALRE